MMTMFQWFDESIHNFDNSDINVAKIVASIWKRVHPPSYFLYRRKKIDACDDPKRHGYNTASFRKNQKVFDGMPHTFSTMKKRVISIIAGDSIHFICYLAINFGSHFKDGSSPKKEPSFIVNVDSSGGLDGMNPFVQWLLAVIYKVEVWVTKFLNTPSLVLIDSPSLSAIGRKCKRMIRSNTHIVCTIPIPHVTAAPTQEDTYNCGIFSVLNSRAAFLADLNHHVAWPLVVDAQSLWNLVLEPFWELPSKSK